MFMADGGIPDLHVVGPQGLTHALAAFRLYAYRFVLSSRLGPSYRPHYPVRAWMSPP